MKMISSFKMFSVELLIQIFGEILKEPMITFFNFYAIFCVLVLTQSRAGGEIIKPYQEWLCDYCAMGRSEILKYDRVQ